jgi:hypothetical protein
MNRQQVAETAATALKEKRMIARFPNIPLQHKGRSAMLWRRTTHALIVRDARHWVRRHIQAISGIANLARIFPYPPTVDRACRFSVGDMSRIATLTNPSPPRIPHVWSPASRRRIRARPIKAWQTMTSIVCRGSYDKTKRRQQCLTAPTSCGCVDEPMSERIKVEKTGAIGDAPIRSSRIILMLAQ